VINQKLWKNKNTGKKARGSKIRHYRFPYIRSKRKASRKIISQNRLGDSNCQTEGYTTKKGRRTIYRSARRKFIAQPVASIGV